MNTLQLAKELYAEALVHQTIQVFSGLCEVELSEDERYYTCAFHRTKYESVETMHEFENYLIDLHNQRGNR